MVLEEVIMVGQSVTQNSALETIMSLKNYRYSPLLHVELEQEIFVGHPNTLR